MATHDEDEFTVGVTAVKAKCLGLIAEVVQGKEGQNCATNAQQTHRSNCPFAEVEGNLNTLDGVRGLMKDLRTIVSGVHLPAPIDVEWDALS